MQIHSGVIVVRRRDSAVATAKDLKLEHETYLAQVAHVAGYDVKYNGLVTVVFSQTVAPLLRNRIALDPVLPI